MSSRNNSRRRVRPRESRSSRENRNHSQQQTEPIHRILTDPSVDVSVLSPEEASQRIPTSMLRFPDEEPYRPHPTTDERGVSARKRTRRLSSSAASPSSSGAGHSRSRPTQRSNVPDVSAGQATQWASFSTAVPFNPGEAQAASSSRAGSSTLGIQKSPSSSEAGPSMWDRQHSRAYSPAVPSLLERGQSSNSNRTGPSTPGAQHTSPLGEAPRMEDERHPSVSQWRANPSPIAPVPSQSRKPRGDTCAKCLRVFSIV